MIEVGTAAADCTVHVLKSVSHVQVGCCTRNQPWFTSVCPQVITIDPYEANSTAPGKVKMAPFFFKKHRPINIQKLYGACIYSIYIYLYYYISICSIFIQCLTPLESIFYLYSIIQHQAIHLGFCPQAVPGEHVINWKPSTIEWRCCRWLERSHGWLKPMAVYHPRYGASWGSASNNL